MFNRFSAWATQAAGSYWAFMVMLFMITAGRRLGWDVEEFGTDISLIMLCILQRSQSKDGLAIQIKLNELVKAHEAARNEIAGIEKMEEKEIKKLDL